MKDTSDFPEPIHEPEEPNCWTCLDGGWLGYREDGIWMKRLCPDCVDYVLQPGEHIVGDRIEEGCGCIKRFDRLYVYLCRFHRVECGIDEEEGPEMVWER